MFSNRIINFSIAKYSFLSQQALRKISSITCRNGDKCDRSRRTKSTSSSRGKLRYALQEKIRNRGVSDIKMGRPLQNTTKERRRKLNSSLLGANTDVESVAKIIEVTLQSAQNRARGFFLPPQEGDRPTRIPLQMDLKWWSWNIAVALTPAFLLIILFEYQTPQYEAYFSEVNELQEKRLMEAMGVEEPLHVSDICDEGNAIPGREISMDVSEASNPRTDGNVKGEQDRTVVQLLQRIDRLERIFHDKAGKERILQYEMERLHQSGIQNRMEDKMIIELAERHKRSGMKDTEDLASVETQIARAAEKFKALYNNSLEKGRNVYDILNNLFNVESSDNESSHELEKVSETEKNYTHSKNVSLASSMQHETNEVEVAHSIEEDLTLNSPQLPGIQSYVKSWFKQMFAKEPQNVPFESSKAPPVQESKEST